MTTAETYTVADYLLDRLAELGVDTMFGVPGDYSLGLLDHVVRHRKVEWVGTSNELNAGYAADGYGRLRGIAALCTTFGVGELSAINAITGSYAEFVPVVHVVGAPKTAAQTAHKMVHHTLGDGIFTHFLAMHADITCAQAALTADQATAEIDRVLATVRDRHLPGYLLVPADVAELVVDPPSAPLPAPISRTDPAAAAAFARAASDLLGTASSSADVSVLVGLLAHRLGAADELAELLAAGHLPHATSLWAKSLADESAPTFVGTYAGAASDEATRRVVEDAPVLIVAGVQFTDLNTGLFSQQITRSRTIEIGAVSSSVGATTFEPLDLRDALARLIPLVSELAGTRPSGPARPVPMTVPTGSEDPTPLTQQLLWDQVAGFLRAGDIVLADQGTCFYGMGTRRLPSGVTFVGQPLWASIGYTLPALLGVGLAEPGRRGVLLIGDGAAQMTVQELATIFRHGLTPVVIVVDNDGYTVERAIHGPMEPYNDISHWDWTSAPAFFGGEADTARVKTVGELRTALERAQLGPDRLTMLQVVVPAMDVPPLLDTLARSLGGPVH
ncbi:MAG: thiamine pyrophosphate-binding protein [Nakamurella sp.]